MPSGSKKPDVGVYSKEQSQAWQFDNQGRGKVELAAVSAGVTVGVSGAITMSSVNASFVSLKFFTNSASTDTILAAQGAGTATEIRGFSVCNRGATGAEVQLRLGNTTPFWYGYLDSKAAFNWNMINHYQKATNKAVVIYLASTATMIASVYWKKA